MAAAPRGERSVELGCGQARLSLRLPARAWILEPRRLPALPDPAGAVLAALEAPLGTPALAELARGRRSACIVVSDVTRPVPHALLLPPLLRTIEAAGVPRAGITLLVATGMHRPNQGEELALLLGPEVAGRYRAVNHSCRAEGELVRIDEIDGCPIAVNRRYLEAELKLLTGLIEPHFYAGYSGGRKSILPGISGLETMRLMHSFRIIDHPRVASCVLDGNPFHEYGLRVAARAGVDFILNAVIDRERRLAGVFAGHLDRAHRAGCDLVASYAIADLPDRADLVITTGGGHPLDATFYQVAKGLAGARAVLRPGGTVLAVAGCAEGLGGPEFSAILRQGLAPAAFRARYADPANFVIDQWCAQSIYQLLEHAGRVAVFSPGLAAADLAGLGMESVEELPAAVAGLLPNHPRVAVMTEGPYVVGRIAGEKGAPH